MFLFSLKKILFSILSFLGLIALGQVFIPMAFWVGFSTLEISPVSSTMSVSTNQTFTATGAAHGVRTFSIISGGGSINAATGVYTAPGTTGSAIIRVTDGRGRTADASVSIVTTITGITVSQSVVFAGVGAVISVTAQVTHAPSGTTDVTTIATWTTSNAAVATVSNGDITFVSPGTATITVSYGGFSQTVSVTVQNKTLTSITVNPNPHTMAVSATRQFTATATYSDSSTQDVTTSAVWTSSDTGKATISNAAPNIGKATGVAAGSTTITATIGSISGSSALTISAATLVSIAITPANYIGAKSQIYQMTATGTYSDATTADITAQVTWSSSNTTAATISNIPSTKGQLTTQNIANYQSSTITATLGAVSGTTPFGVNGAGVINAIIVIPTVTITVGSTYNLQAWGNTSDGGTINITDFVVWTSGTTANVTISNGAGTKGMVTGVAAGTSTITATYGAISGTRVVTVGATPAVTEIGTGLTGAYYNFTGGVPPSAGQSFLPGNWKGTRVDQRVNFAWGSGAAPMGVSNQFMVRWTGFYKAISANNYFCTLSDDGVRLWINGTQYVNNWTEHGPTWNCSGLVTLTVGTKYSVVMEFYENGGGAEAHLTRSSVSAADAQNQTTRAIPQVDLYPN